MTRKQIGTILGAIVLAVAAPILTLALLHGLDGWVSAQPTEQYPTFSIEDGGPSSTSQMGPFDPADILYLAAPGTPAQCIPCNNLGLSGCTSLGAPVLDDLDALTYGADFGAYDSAVGYLGFSVDTGSSGQPGTAVNIEASCIPAEPEADEFTTQLDGNNSQYFDGNGVPCGANAGASLGLFEPSGDDLDAIDNKECWEIVDQDGFPNRFVYFSLTPGSPTLPLIAVAPTGRPANAADVLVTVGVPMGPPWVYATEAQLGLGTYGDGDDVNGLCLADTAMDDIFDPDGTLTGFRDYLFYTVTSTSPSIPSVVPDAATIMYVPAPGVAVPVDLATALGLLDDNTDDVDAIKCVKGLVDISIEEFYITLPDDTIAPPATNVTLIVSQWYDFLMTELKHYAGISEELSPPSVTSMVGWAVLGAVPGLLNVRFNAQPGDICTDEKGAPVPCGEGGVAGLPWNPAALPNPPAPGIDSCKDGEDNDGDGLVDFADPDCVDIYDVHFEINLPWCLSVPVDREVQIHCKEPGDFEIAFQNIEMPLGADDIDLEGVENNELEIPLTIICEEAAAQADKDVMAIVFDDAGSYPLEGTDIGNEFDILTTENVPFSVTSVDYNWGPDEPADAEISFYAYVPDGCSGRWYDPAGHFPLDIQTIDGDYNVPSSGTTYFPPEKEPGPRWLDLHFQTAEYGLTEPPAIEDPGSPTPGFCNDGIDNGDGGAGPCDFWPDACWPGSMPDPDCDVAANAQRYTRYFEIHCPDGGDYVFEFCNRADVKSPDTDPDASNNLRCATLTVHAEAPPLVDLEKLELQVKPFYCADSDMDGDEATGLQVAPGTGTCCDGVDNDGDTATDGQDSGCWAWMNEDPVDDPPYDDDSDGLVDEDPPTYGSGQTCPWNGDDDCDGDVDEDPKNGIDDDGDAAYWNEDGSYDPTGGGNCANGQDDDGDGTWDANPPNTVNPDPECMDEDPANGFLGIDNDGDGWVDEDGAGRFDFNGNTVIDPCVGGGEPEVKWEQPPDLSPMGIDVSALYWSDLKAGYALADDYECTTPGPITEIRIWGSWKDNIEPPDDPANMSLTLSIHADVPAAGEDPSHPGDVLWWHTYAPYECEVIGSASGDEGWLDPPESYTFADHNTAYQYSCLIPPENQFEQEGTPEGPIVYWLDVQAPITVAGTHPQFGWKTADPAARWNDDAVYAAGGSEVEEPITDPSLWQPLYYPPGHEFWTLEGETLDLAFEIIGAGEPHLFCEEQFEGVDDDGDTEVDEDPLDSHAPVAGETVEVRKWHQKADGSTDGMDVNATWFYDDEPDPTGFALADDWECTTTGPVTKIVIVGSWLDDDYPDWPPYVSLTLSIHEDVPEGHGEPFSHPGDVLWSYTYAAGECGPYYYYPDLDEGWMNPPDEYIYPGDTVWWIYECPGPDPDLFIQEGTPELPVVYWLDVQAELSASDPYLFGWKTSYEHNIDDAVYAVNKHEPDILPSDWQPLVYPPDHPNVELRGTTIDLAFDIYTEETVAQVSQPHYRIKELLRNNSDFAVLAEDIKRIDAPAWKADALEDGLTTCNDGLDNDMDGMCDATGRIMDPDPNCGDPSENELGGTPDGTCGNSLDDDGDGTCDWDGCDMPPDPECTAEHGGEEQVGLHSCNDGLDNGGDGPFDEWDSDCATATEVSLEILSLDHVISVGEGVPAYVKVRDPNSDHPNKCQPPKIPLDSPYNMGGYETAADNLTYGGTPVAVGDCIAVDSVPGVYKELDYQREVSLAAGEQRWIPHQADLACEDRTSLHKFIIQNEFWPLDAIESNPDNNELDMEMLVACLGFGDAWVYDLVVPTSPWNVTVSTSDIRTVSVEALNISPVVDDFILSFQEESPGMAGLVDDDDDGWADNVEQLLGSLPIKDSTPESIHVPGTCSDGENNDLRFGADAGDPKCIDSDGDGYSDAEEVGRFHSDPHDPSKTPEHMFFPWTCNDGIDNDQDGYCDDVGGCPGATDPEQDDDGDAWDDCTDEQLAEMPAPVVCASGWVRQGTDREYIYLDQEGKLTVGLNVPLNNWGTNGGGGGTVSRDLVLHCFEPHYYYPDNVYPTETITATIRPAGAHMIETWPGDEEVSGTFNGQATCPAYTDLTLESWTGFDDVPDPIYVGENHLFTTTKRVSNSVGGTDVSVRVLKTMDVPPGCDGSLHATYDGETVTIAPHTTYWIGTGDPITTGDDPATEVLNYCTTIYVEGSQWLEDNAPLVNELEVTFNLPDPLVAGTYVDVQEDFDIECHETGVKHFDFHNNVSVANWPNVCDLTIDDQDADGVIERDVQEAAVEVDLEKAGLFVKPFYCGDSDLDGEEDYGHAGGAHPHSGNCCDGADNDGDTLTDGQDSDCTPYINEDPVDGTDNDGDGLVDEDPPSYDAGLPLSCPWNGDDDCDGHIDEDPKNNINDDPPINGNGSDYLIDEDPANGFLGIDNDKDHLVDEDGAGRFDFNGNTVIDECVEYVGYGFLCEEQLEGVDDDGDTSVDEDPLDSPLPWAGDWPTIKWEQEPNLTPDGWDVNATTAGMFPPIVLADDFACTESGLITQIDFWASWFMDYVPLGEDPQAVGFTLSIHDNFPGPPSRPEGPPLALWYFEPGDCEAELYATESPEGFYDPVTGFNESPADWTVWLYSCEIPLGQEYPQVEGTIYWLDLQAFPMDPEATFGWKTSVDQWMDDGVWAMGEEPVPDPEWYPLENPVPPYQSLDLAFRIWGQRTGPPVIHEPHYLIKELLLNPSEEPVMAVVTTELDAPAWRADAREDGHTTCDDSLDNDSGPCDDDIDNDRDGTCDWDGCNGMPADDDCPTSGDTEGDGLTDGDDPECQNEHIGEEQSGLHSCNDGIDNGDGDGFDEADDDCATLTEVSVECEDDLDVITVKAGVDWYIKPSSLDPVLTIYPGCEQYYDPAHFSKCVPCKIPAADFYTLWGQPMPDPDVVAGAYCVDLVPPFGPPMFPGYCIAVDSAEGVYKELDIHQQVDLDPGSNLLSHQYDLSCEDKIGQHKFIIQNEVQPLVGDDPNPANNELEMEMLVECLTDCSPGVDSDGDTFNDDIECYLPTDPSDDCPDTIGAHDAWPMDINMDKKLNILDDVLNYRGRIGSTPGDPNWLQRLDLNMDSKLNILDDVLLYRGHIGDTCT